MSLSVIQSNSATVSSGTTHAVQFTTQNVTAASLIVVNVATANTTDSVSTVKDNINNTNYTLGVSKTGTSPGNTYQYYFPNSGSGNMTVTVTYTAGLTGGDAVWIDEVGGAATSSPVDVTGSSSGTSTNVTSGNITTLNANDILFGCCNLGGSVSSSESGWTNVTNNGDGMEYIIESSTVTAAATWVQSPSSAFNAIIGSYKAAAGSTVALPSTTMQAALGITTATLKGLIAGGSVVQIKGAFGITTATLKGLLAGGATVPIQGKFGIAGQIGKLAIALVNLKALLGITGASPPGQVSPQDRPYTFWGGGHN